MTANTKRVLQGLGLTFGILILVGGGAYLVGTARLQTQMDEGLGHDLVVPDDAASIASGDRLARLYGCRDCHGEDLGGTQLINEPAFAVLAAPNLTTGTGSAVAGYSDRDWERAIRHGLAADGRALAIMPSASYTHFSDRDIGELVAFLRQAPAVNRAYDPPDFGPAARMAALATGGELLQATTIDHDAVHPDAVERGPSLAYGAYLAQGCAGCHGTDFGGKKIMGSDFPAANITPHEATGIGAWSFDDFNRALRTGFRPDGTRLDEGMPWKSLSALTEGEMQALWRFFRGIDPVERAHERPAAEGAGG